MMKIVAVPVWVLNGVFFSLHYHGVERAHWQRGWSFICGPLCL